MRGDWFQLSLIFLAVVVTALFGGFLYRELFPEYKKYQNAYVALEEFRSTYTGQPPPLFDSKIKQIVLEQDDKGPAVIDRCTSCHVAVQFSHFSPTRPAEDINGNPVLDAAGLPVLEDNPDYIWAKLDQKIEMLKSEGNEREAERLQALKTVEVGDHVYDMTKVLSAHPLIGRETRPFESHPIDEYGCTVCHNGNGRGLTTEKAHGPVFDGKYEPEYMGKVPEFTEKDPDNDPLFSKIFNHKPGHKLLFQTTPIYVGALLQANCVQCHNSTESALQDAAREAGLVAERRGEKSKAVEEAYQNEKNALASLVTLKKRLQKEGWSKTVEGLTQESQDYTRSQSEVNAARSQLDFIRRLKNQEAAIKKIRQQVEISLGSSALADKLMNSDETIDQFIEKNVENAQATGFLFAKRSALIADEKLKVFASVAESTISDTAKNEDVKGALKTEIDILTSNFHRGEQLYISQACYACHRIDGLARGGVGPELTYIGNSYPWYIKESMVWPQADLKTSTMPNFHLDHEELEDLTTFLLAQKGRRSATSEASHKTRLLQWEAGYKLPWERPINPGELYDLRYSMTVFATEGCAACHRLKGFESNVGFSIEKDNQPAFKELFEERQWFRKVIPENISGSELVEVLEKNSDQIDEKIINNVRSGSLLEEIKGNYPQIVESYNTEFKFASRAKNNHFKDTLAKAETPQEKQAISKEWSVWKERVNRVLMMYIQEYGFGRLIGPRPNWSGIYRSDEWLIEHFRKPSKHVARSIMPVMPFDDSKFYALTNMLNQLAVYNRDGVRQIWDTFGFDPKLAYEFHCAQCHGDHLRGNGPVADWIYPIPKNLGNADFLRNLTRSNATFSIVHGVNGGPMPPWGEVARGKSTEVGDTPVLTGHEIEQLVDWLYAPLAGGAYIQSEEEVDKWQYQPEDVLEELEKEGNTLDPGPPPEFLDLKKQDPTLGNLRLPTGEQYLASLNPTAAVSGGEPISRVGKVFDVYPNPYFGDDKYVYYIKKRYYTEENLQQGQALYELNCAACHGKEADGQGYRAGTMYDAKPRMLTNFPWINMRDDLRLLRSIKYGVAGTSMIPWGDQTNSLQRLQLVMYIRSLTKDQQQRDQLISAVYDAFDEQDQVLEKARVEQYVKVNALKEELNSVKTNALKFLSSDEAPKEDAMGIYQQELTLNRQIKEFLDLDQLIVDLKDKVKKESQIYQNIGIQFLGMSFEGNLFDQYLDLLGKNNVQYQLKNGKLEQKHQPQKEKEIEKSGRKIFQEIQENIRFVEVEKEIVEGKLPSKERSEKIEDLSEKIQAFKNLQKVLISGLEEAKRLREDQLKLYTKYESKLKKLEVQ